MSTKQVIETVEAGIKGLSDRLDASLDEWRSSTETERAAVEEKIKGLDEAIQEMRSTLTEVQRSSLPGSEPGEDGGKKFSMAKACHAIRLKDWSDAGFEKEVFDNTKAMSSGTDSAGGYIVPDESIPQVIERLKAEVVAFQLGAREMTAEGSPILIPRLATSATANWITGENSSIGASDLGFEQISMSPKTLAARVIMSNQLLELSTPTADAVIDGDVASQLTIGADQGIIEGSGASGQPRGIINDPNVLTNTVTALPTWSELNEVVDALAQANSLRGKLGWAFHPANLLQLQNVVNPTNIDIERRMLTEGTLTKLLGYPFRTTTSFTATTGADSLIFGNWDDVIVAMWGGLRLSASDVADSAFSNDQTHIRAIMRMDTVLRHSSSFCIAA